MPAGTADPKPNELPAVGSNIPIPSTGIFIVNVPLYAHSSDFSSCDKFAASFNNSTRRTLSYVSPSIQNGEVIVRSSIDVVREGSRWWDSTAVGYFFGRKPYYHHLNEYVRSVWPAVKAVTAMSNSKWKLQWRRSSKGVLGCSDHPSKVGTGHGIAGIGHPLYPDSITRTCTRLYFTRVCVMLDISSTLPRHLIIMMPNEDGSEVPCKVEVEYEWVPPKCKQCVSLGHSTAACPKAKQTVKSHVAMYVQKRPTTMKPPPAVFRPSLLR
ncbi:UNVERIFIED_CONTAM: hypothetical protein Sradi_6936400 [Sesamum radiatum]|uniref:DUF4283 domain-containing protein n=1 Tax=Sesamum radiatum TaxID=300843 RepID=A0AAW2JI95_SESRA